MKFYYGLPGALIGVGITLVQPQIAVALSSAEVGKIAKQITVRIERIDKKSLGSGVMIKRQGNTYYVLTSAHVVETADKYEIVTPDGDRYQIDDSTLKKRAGVDLAVVQFTSSKTYTVAKIGNSDKATEGSEAYVAGFPAPSSARPYPEFNFMPGNIIANGSQPQPDGYTLVYSNNTLPGFSGGPVLNENGELVAVHGRSETTVSRNALNKNFETITTGNNLGIPINTFLRLSFIDVGVRPPSLKTATAPTAADFYIQGVNKYEKGDYQSAISRYNQAIRLNTNYAEAYFNRGLAHYNLGDKQGAIEAFNQAIRLEPNYAEAYSNRGLVRSDLADKQGAISDYNHAIRLEPKLAHAYNGRGIVRYNLEDSEGAILDYNHAIRLNPNYAEAYSNRGLARYKLADKQGAIEDYNQAIRLEPKLTETYTNRGFARYELGDNQGAVEDYNQAIHLNPQYAKAYIGRGLARGSLGDEQGRFADLQQAASLAQQQSDTNLYQELQNLIREVQQ